MLHYTKFKDEARAESGKLRSVVQEMAKVNCSIEEGLIPAEKIVRIENADGDIEEVSVSNGNISDNKLVASEIGRREGRVLVELPRESASGRWRIWVKASAVGA